MKTKLITMAATLALGLSLAQLTAGEPEWMTDLAKAQAKAKAEKKMMMLDFTGSDWCGWCIKLHKEVFSTPEFAKYAEKNLVLVEVDFPKSKKQDEKLKQANNELKTKYKISGFPTIIVLDGDGQKLGQLDYGSGVTPEELKGDVKKLKAKPALFTAQLDKLKSKA